MAAGSTGCAFAAIALASTLTASPGRPDAVLEVELDFILEMVVPKTPMLRSCVNRLRLLP